MKYITRSCPHCHHSYQVLSQAKHYYGSPIVKCKKCGKVFFDKDAVELACVLGDEYFPKKVTGTSFFLCILGLIHMLPILMGPPLSQYGAFGVCLVLAGIFMVIYDISSYDERYAQYQEELVRSRSRLSDPQYVQTLVEMKYYVPESIRAEGKYIQKEEINPTNTKDATINTSIAKPSNLNKEYPKKDSALLAKSICDFLWTQAFSFMKEANIPRTAYNITFFWSVFYYSIADILDQEDVNDLVLREFVLSTSRVLHIPPYEVEQLATIKKLRDATLKTLFEVRPDPANAYGISQILESYLVLRFPDGNEPEEAKPTPSDVVELMLTIAEVTKYVCQIFNTSAAFTAIPPREAPSVSEPTLESAPVEKNLLPIVVALSMVIIIGFFGLIIFSPSTEEASEQVASTAVTTVATVTEPTYEPVPEPVSGQIINAPEGQRLAPLQIRTLRNSKYNMYFKLKSKTNPQNNLSFFIRSGSDTTVLVPLGEYSITCVYGECWYGPEVLFGESARATHFSEEFLFNESKIGYNGYCVNITLPGANSVAVPFSYAPVPIINAYNGQVIRSIGKPESGTILYGYEQQYGSQITVTADKGASCVVSLKSAYGIERLAFFVRAGDTVTVGVPRENLQVFFASGDIWMGYGEGLMFGQDTIYTKDDEALDFINNSWEYTLTPITYGNFTESPSSENEFF